MNKHQIAGFRSRAPNLGNGIQLRGEAGPCSVGVGTPFARGGPLGAVRSWTSGWLPQRPTRQMSGTDVDCGNDPREPPLLKGLGS
jgi:hypothetical protein